MGEIFFTADLHFCHNKDFIYNSRGFNSIEEMNEKIVDNFKSEIGSTDELYILGDLMLNDNEKGLELIASIPGFKWIIIGNHDTQSRIEAYRSLENCDVIGFSSLKKISKRNSFYLSHYPTITSNGMEKAPICLHGHTHSKDPLEYSHFNCVNVGLDAWDCKPVHIEQIYNIKLNSMNYKK